MVFETRDINNEELAAYFDGLALRLNNNPSAKSLIRISGGRERFYAYPYLRGAEIKAFLKNNREMPVERFTIQFCNINKEPFGMQVFILEENEKIEPCEENLTVPEKTVLFEYLSFYGDAEFSSKKPLEETLFYTVDPGEQLYSQITQNALLRLLNASPDSKIYLVGYLEGEIFGSGANKKLRKTDKPKVIDKILRNIEKEFVQSGIDASRIVKIDGGYKQMTKNVEIWFVPQGGELPKPKPAYSPKKRNKK